MSRELAYYDIDLQINGISFALNVISVHIVNSIYSVFQNVFISVKLDSQEVISSEIYGQTDLKLIIRQMTEDKQEQDTTEITLFLMKILGGNSQKPENEQTSPMSDRYVFICIPKNPWSYMTKTVCYLASNTSPKSPYDAAADLVKKFLPNVTTKMDNKNANMHVPEQIPIPPMNFAAALFYLDERYGIYRGPLFFETMFEEDTFNMWDLSQKIKDKEDYTVYVLGSGKKETDEIYKKSGTDEETFYTYSNISFKNHTSGNVGLMNFEHNHVMKPMDSLYKMNKINMNDMFDSSLPNDGGKLVLHPDLMNDNSRYIARSFVGSDYDDSAIRASISKSQLIQTEGKFRMDRNLRLKRLLHVGVPIMLSPESATYQPIYGKYLVKSSTIKLSRHVSKNYSAIADIEIFRSNIQI